MKKTLLTTAAAALTLAIAPYAFAGSPEFHPIADADFLAGTTGPGVSREVPNADFNALADADLLAGQDASAFASRSGERPILWNSLADADILAGRDCSVPAVVVSAKR